MAFLKILHSFLHSIKEFIVGNRDFILKFKVKAMSSHCLNFFFLPDTRNDIADCQST